MAQIKTDISKKSVWVVEAECSGDKASWTFDDKDVAEWFRDIAQDSYRARCPTCGAKDILNLQVSVGILEEVIVSCGYYDCEFAKRIVRTTTGDDKLMRVSGLACE